jgi:uncharacterized cupredoxin-like copper-binding protein
VTAVEHAPSAAPGAGRADPGAADTGAAETRVGAGAGVADTGTGPPARGARRSRRRWLGLALVVAAVVAAAGYALVAARAEEPELPVLGPGTVTVALDVEHSLFSAEHLRVVAGTRVRFVVANGDPIDHELIVGPPDVHARHAQGTEAEHPSVPGEVSVGAGATGITAFRFDRPGTFEFACHLPGHYEFGMRGTVEVVPPT